MDGHDSEVEVAEGCRGRCVRLYARVVVKFPHTFCCSCAVVMLLLSAMSIASGAMALVDEPEAWLIMDAERTMTFKAWTHAKRQALGEPGDYRRLENNSNDSPPLDAQNGGLVQHKWDGEWWTLTFLYKSDAEGSGNVFTPARLQEMCRLEALVVGQPLTWAVSDSAARLFYQGQAGYASCAELDQGVVSTKLAAMYLDVAANGAASQYARFVHPSFASTGTSAYSRTSMEIRGPQGMDLKAHRVYITEDVILKDLGLSYGFLRSALQAEDDRFQPSGPLRVRLAYESDEDNRMIMGDFMLAFSAVAIVFLIVYLHVNSGFLACVTMYQIILSLPVGALLYRRVLMIDFFDFLHMLVVYLVLGIGADDVFVLVDSFRHLSSELPAKDGGSFGDLELAKLLQLTLVRSGQAIFSTSFTTTVAFLSQSVSGIMPMRTCGYYAAVCIILNFVFTMLFTPSALIIYHKRFEGKRCCCPWPTVRPEELPAGKGADCQTRAGAQTGLHGGIDQFLERLYIPAMRRQFRGVRVCALSVVATMLATTAQGVYFTLQLTPPTQEEVWVPQNHMLLGISEFWSNHFYEADFEKYSVITFTWGIEGADTTSFDPYRPSKNPPRARFDPGFDITTAEAQAEILGVCAEMQALRCELDGCQGYGNTLMMSSGTKAYSCFLEDLQHYRVDVLGRPPSEALPTGSAFVAELRQFVQADPSSQYSSKVCPAEYAYDVGFIDGQLKYVSVKLRSRLALVTPHSVGVDVRDMIQEFVQGRQGAAPSGLKSMSFNAGGVFAVYDLSEELVMGLLTGISIAFPLAFLVLLASTRNFIVSMYAVFCVAGIVACVLGFCKSAMGWDLGVGEAIAGVIVIGYSVDYVVHLAHVYCEAAKQGHQTRDARATFAVRNMGSTIYAGAVTTAGSSAVMLFCYFTFFNKMATLICVTIMYSFLFSMGLFTGLLWLIGPQGTCGDICCCRGRARGDETGAVPDVEREDAAKPHN